MSYFNKNRVTLWLVVAVLLINTAAIATILYKMYNEPLSNKPKKGQPCMQSFLEKKLELTPVQAKKFRIMKKAHHDSVAALRKLMDEKRSVISENLSKTEPDSLLLYSTADDLGVLYAQVRKMFISHYLNLRKVCTSEQQLKLAGIYSGVFCHDDCMHKPFGFKSKKKHKECKRERF
ncbi:MAG: hypothetical protein PHR81_04215 [Bacteroidales bacterium]|jgi:Spy/CpxP family protein refolding chaperone|nr:periplasmic heavy metal sensor [Bacteroidales bacterium]MDD4213997.1 hypothetical protein [Bacteroidales bacterium]